ncbi:MAG: hypothetical protein AVO33_05620 [delta proteobacterium ML8_F1]|nr:MAG: hypothetical protein AVO33_05620 [delta proteobacterium ML8_F1]
MRFSHITIMDIPIYNRSQEEAFKIFIRFSKENRVRTIYTPNTEMVMMAQEDPEFKEILKRSDLNLPDGIGLKLFARIHGLNLAEKIAGVEFMERILDFCEKTEVKIYLLGGAEGVAEEAARLIVQQYPHVRVVGTQHGYFQKEDEPHVIDAINEASPNILFVGLGAPRQEKWIHLNKRFLDAEVVMGVGGSIDVFAKKVKRAPPIFINLGLEWLYRLLKQPSRIKRMARLPRFILIALYQRFF